jgi:SPP1 gp7 family putative phage head morphogenesis protein
MGPFEWLRSKFAAPAVAPKQEDPGKPPLGAQAWAVGTLIYGEGDFAPYNQDELMIKKGRDIYKTMLRDDQVKAVALFKRGAVTSRGWTFDKEESEETESGYKPEHEKIEEYYKDVIKNLKTPFKDACNNVLTSMFYGYSVNEKVWQPVTHDRDGKAYWDIVDVVLLPFWTFDRGIVVDRHNNPLKFKQHPQGTARSTIELSPEKVIYQVYQKDMDPVYGESDLRAAHRHWWSKDITIKFQNIYLERHAGGMVIASVTQQGALADPAEKAKLQKILERITAYTSLFMPYGTEAKIEKPVNTDAYERAINNYNSAIARSLLMPNLMGLTPQADVGAFAQSKTQFDVFLWVMDSIGSDLESVLNNQFFAPLAWYNFGTRDFPRFKLEPMTDDEKRELAKTWADLVSKNAVTHSEPDEDYTRELLGYPKKPEDVPIAGAQKPEDVIAGAIGKLKPGDDKTDKDDKGKVIPDKEDDEEPVKKENTESWLQTKDIVRQHTIRHQLASKSWLRRVNFQRLETDLNAQDKEFSDRLNALMAQVGQSIEAQVEKIAAGRSMGALNPKEIEPVAIPKKLLSAVRSTIRDSLQKTLDVHYELAKQELPRRQMAKIIRPGMDKTQAERFLASKAMKITGVLNNDVLKAVQQVLENGIKYDKTMTQTINALREDTSLVALLPEYDAAGRVVNVAARLENIVRTNDADAMNQARMALFNEPEMQGFVLAFEYSAIMDDRTTEICESLDGHVQEDWGSLTPPNHYQCRSLLIPITTVDNWDGRESRLPKGAEPQKGFA